MSALLKIRQSGFDLSVIGDNQLAVTPAQNLTDNQRDFLKQHKAEIISELQAERLGKTEQLPKLVKCGNCSHWRGHHQHQRGSGFTGKRCLSVDRTAPYSRNTAAGTTGSLAPDRIQKRD